jgi:hypothetical protein
VEIAQSALQVLNRLGIEPCVLANERCCGHDLLWEGDLSAFHRLAELNATLLRATGARRLVTTCPECAHTLKVEYRQQGHDVGMEVLHIAQLLASDEGIRESGNQQIDKSAIENRKSKITYHDPCRLGRYLKVYDEPRQVIAMLGAELVEMENCRARSLCCGTSGWTNCGATAKSIQVDRLREAKATGAEVDTGTDDAKFLTAKAVNDSHNVPMVAPSTSGNFMTSNGTDWVSTAPGAPTAHALSGHTIATANLALGGYQITDQVIHTVANETARRALTPLVGKLCFQTDALAAYICTASS